MTRAIVTAEGASESASPHEPKRGPAHEPTRSRSASANGTRAANSLGPADWLRVAQSVLIHKSVDAVRIDVLAKELKVTRGSFYWHFKDRDDLLQRLLIRWRDEATEQVISRFERRGAEPRELIHELFSLPFRGRAAHEAASIELAIRAWARRDQMARQALDTVDAQRLSYISQCLSSISTLTIAESRNRAFVLYGYLVAESLLQHHGSDTQRAERRQWLEAAVLGGV